MSLQSERLLNHMQGLRLTHLPHCYEALAEEASVKDLPYLEFLEQALEAESQAKHTRNVRLKTQWAHFPYKKGLDQFDFAFQPSVDERKLRELAGLAFLERKENVLLLGPPGVGKTHLGIALGTEAIVAGFSVYFLTMQDLVQQFQRARDENKLKERMALLVKPKLLILDEIGYLSLDSFAATCLFQLVSERYEKGSIILTSNKSYGDWAPSSPTTSSPRPSWTGCSITPPPSTSRARATGSRTRRRLASLPQSCQQGTEARAPQSTRKHAAPGSALCRIPPPHLNSP
jgi:DNA replication protein DnaC